MQNVKITVKRTAKNICRQYSFEQQTIFFQVVYIRLRPLSAFVSFA